MKSGKTCTIRKFPADESAWADFLISKAALVLSSIVFFAAFFSLLRVLKILKHRKSWIFLQGI
jgi:hypothetical protein